MVQSWFKSYWSERKQIMSRNDQQYSPNNLYYGVPQALISRPVLLTCMHSLYPISQGHHSAPRQLYGDDAQVHVIKLT